MCTHTCVCVCLRCPKCLQKFVCQQYRKQLKVNLGAACYAAYVSTRMQGRRRILGKGAKQINRKQHIRYAVATNMVPYQQVLQQIHTHKHKMCTHKQLCYAMSKRMTKHYRVTQHSDYLPRGSNIWLFSWTMGRVSLGQNVWNVYTLGT